MEIINSKMEINKRSKLLIRHPRYKRKNIYRQRHHRARRIIPTSYLLLFQNRWCRGKSFLIKHAAQIT